MKVWIFKSVSYAVKYSIPYYPSANKRSRCPWFRKDEENGKHGTALTK